MMKNRYASPSSSPPTPPTSPLPVSTGPGYQNYCFSSSPSPSPSPPFSPPPSTQPSAEILPLHQFNPSTSAPPLPPSVFSLDHLHPRHDDDAALLSTTSSCLKDLLEWLVLRCCSCCSWPLFSSQPNPIKHRNY